jgi:hypothetical protein
MCGERGSNRLLYKAPGARACDVYASGVWQAHGEKMNAWKQFNDPFPEFTNEHLVSEEVH